MIEELNMLTKFRQNQGTSFVNSQTKIWLSLQFDVGQNFVLVIFSKIFIDLNAEQKHYITAQIK
jgi:hypothetical protein